MEDKMLSSLLLLALAGSSVGLSGPWLAQQTSAAQTIWTGRSGGFVIHWTTADLSAMAESTGAQVLSVVPLAQQGCKDFAASLRQPGAGVEVQTCTYERTFTLLSVVETLVSFADASYAFCQGWAHPAVASRFVGIDLAKDGGIGYAPGLPPFEVDPVHPGKVVRLTDIFAEGKVLDTLRADAVIGQALRRVGGVVPGTLRELAQVLHDQQLAVGECVYRLPADFLTRFVFHHVEPSAVAVRLGLPPAAEACRGQHAQLGILLPMPDTLKPSLARAASGQAGFLMQNQPQLASGQSTTLAFAVDRCTPR
jgi:hypothetical protein